MKIYEDLSNNNDESLFELDFNTLTKVKQFTQQNTSDGEDENIISDTENKIQRCNFTTNLRKLWQMVGMWQIDEEEIKKKHFSIKNLDVCYSHFMYDQNKLHISNLKQTKDYTESIICYRCCLFCNKNIQHSYTVMDVKEEPNCDNMLHHENDTKEALEAIGYWILNIAASEKTMWQKKVLIHLVHIKLNPKDLTPKFFFEFGEVLAYSTILAKNELKLHKKLLESPISIEEYCASFPLYLVQFYDGLLRTLHETKKKIIDRKNIVINYQKL
ncbi:hypothetical protein C1646_764519 [Rhizophagus diaphanus]|nr:hypothetical protein C1646_764519 [Rhizophagus diaphanus] [Rhizophagus sp. MUCL 43196]